MRGVYYGLLPQLLCPPSLLIQIEIQGSLLRAAQASVSDTSLDGLAGGF